MRFRSSRVGFVSEGFVEGHTIGVRKEVSEVLYIAFPDRVQQTLSPVPPTPLVPYHA